MLQALKDWTKWLARWFVVGMIVAFLIGLLPGFRDDTDPAWPAHSGLVPRADALTGCQYLSTADGGLTPRLDSDGKQIGCRR